jgi:Transcription factor WhiB
MAPASAGTLARDGVAWPGRAMGSNRTPIRLAAVRPATAATLMRCDSFADVQAYGTQGCGKGKQMTVSLTPAAADYWPTTPAPDRATGWRPYPPVAIPCTDRALWMRVIRHARCAGSSLEPDQWFPVSVEIDKARREAAAAIAVCTTCLVRTECLALSLRHWDIGQHGIWGGLVAAERAALPHRRHATMIRTSPASTAC